MSLGNNHPVPLTCLRFGGRYLKISMVRKVGCRSRAALPVDRACLCGRLGRRVAREGRGDPARRLFPRPNTDRKLRRPHLVDFTRGGAIGCRLLVELGPASGFVVLATDRRVDRFVTLEDRFDLVRRDAKSRPSPAYHRGVPPRNTRARRSSDVPAPTVPRSRHRSQCRRGRQPLLPPTIRQRRQVPTRGLRSVQDRSATDPAANAAPMPAPVPVAEMSSTSSYSSLTYLLATRLISLDGIPIDLKVG